MATRTPPRPKTKYCKCGAVLSRYRIEGEGVLCWACREARYEVPTFEAPPDEDDTTVENEIELRKIEEASKPPSALEAKRCQCEKPVAVQDDLEARCLTCGKWLL